MNSSNPIKRAPGCLLAIALLAAAAVTPASAASAPDLQGQLALRPLTPHEMSQYGLEDLQRSGGLSTVGLGEAVYLEALINIQIPASDIVGVDWVLTNKPAGSMAVLAPSPLGTNVPTYKMADRLVAQVAGRKMLRPDLAGEYTVVATITTASSGTTNVSQTITAGTYMGINTCALCHSGGEIAPNKVEPWSHTGHATMFTEAIDGLKSSHYSASCIECHTVGYDTNTNAVNGGFDDVAMELGWTFPTVLTNGNWDAVPAKLKNVSNIQCENCHGPGSQHAFSLGDTNLIAVNYSAGNCAQCHDEPPHHSKNAEWNNSLHAVTVNESRTSCVGCHSGIGFIDRVNGVPEAQRRVDYEAIGCATCHEPHDATNPHQIRTVADVTLEDGTTVTNGGNGKLCMECHHARQDAATYATSYHSHFGPHHGPQTDMLEGANGYTYGKAVPSSAHRTAVGDTCVTCHMQTVADTDPAFTHAGGHTFSPAWENGPNGAVDLVGACQQCHGSSVTDFDFKLQDYDGDGVIDGVQTEVQHLMNKLALLLPPVGQSKDTVSPDDTWTAPQLEAAYNYLFVQDDGSMGIHNTAYAVGLLKASIADLTGDANNDGLPDAWQIQYFGSINDPNAAPDATPAGDGVPNWLKYSLGLDPKVAGVTVPGGVVWANGKDLVNPPIDPNATNTIAIYTAAEVVFNTQTNASYQIQAISSLGGSWENVGDPIQGTGSSISYVTPTRQDVQQFYRVVHTP